MRLAADRIEPYKTPQGDGNHSIEYHCFMVNTIEPYKTPQGDGNTVRRGIANLSANALNLIKPRKGTETRKYGASSAGARLNLIKPRKGTETIPPKTRRSRILHIEPYKTPQGDGNQVAV